MCNGKWHPTLCWLYRKLQHSEEKLLGEQKKILHPLPFCPTGVSFRLNEGMIWLLCLIKPETGQAVAIYLVSSTARAPYRTCAQRSSTCTHCLWSLLILPVQNPKNLNRGRSTCLMYAQLWSMPALSGMAPYVKRMPYSSKGSRLQSPVASSKLRGAHPKVNYFKLSIGHHSAGGVKSQVCVCSIAYSTFNKSHWQTAYHPLPLLAIHDPRGSQGNWFFQQPGQRDTPPLSSLAHQWHGTLSPHTFKT